jgi:undecaprenyl-diphosphatase
MGMSLWQGLRQRDDRWLFLFWGWAPTFGLMLVLSLRQKVQANWAAPAYITSVMAAMVYLWYRRGAVYSGVWQRLWLAGAGMVVMLALGMTLALHDPGLFVRWGLEPSADPLARLKGWRALAQAVERLREQRSKPPFVLSDRYQISSELAFYLSGQPHTYNINLGRRLNQYDLWNGLPTLVGHDAVYIQPDNVELPQALQAIFHRCDEGEPVIIEELGRELKRFYLFQCQGFSGVPPRPPQVRY